METYFNHNKNFNSGITYCPVNSKGEVIPHIFGHLRNYVSIDTHVFGGIPTDNYFLTEIEKFDFYKVIETVENDIFGNTKYTPVSFVPVPFAALNSVSSVTVCDCADCCVDSSNIDYCPNNYTITKKFDCNFSGIFAVKKGEQPVDLIQFEGGKSCFPEIFKLKKY